jgi:hypothetical protein
MASLSLTSVHPALMRGARAVVFASPVNLVAYSKMDFDLLIDFLSHINTILDLGFVVTARVDLSHVAAALGDLLNKLESLEENIH